jgi:hypothetical protein
MELRIGVVAQTLMQSKIKHHHHQQHLARGGNKDKPGAAIPVASASGAVDDGDDD